MAGGPAAASGSGAGAPSDQEAYRQIEQIAAVLTHIMSVNADLRDRMPTPFDAASRPGAPAGGGDMSVLVYLVRIRRFTRFDNANFFIALGYLGRLIRTAGPAFCPTHHNVHRLLITALLVASKTNDDVHHRNSFMARCGGVSTAELSALEIEFCRILRWRLFIPEHRRPKEVERLLDALRDPHDAYWSRWFNQVDPRSVLSPAASPEGPSPRSGGIVEPLEGDGARAEADQALAGSVLFGAGSERPCPQSPPVPSRARTGSADESPSSVHTPLSDEPPRARAGDATDRLGGPWPSRQR